MAGTALPFPQITLDDYLHDLQPTDLVLTATNRLARELRLRFGADDSRLLPRVVPYASWLQDGWQRLRFESALNDDDALATTRLLSQHQEEVLWDQVLRDAGAEERLLFLDSTVAACMRAESLLRQYRVPREDEAWERSDETRLFLEWLQQVETHCEAQGWLLPSTLPALLSQNLTTLGYQQRQRLFLVGFEEPTPAQTTLFEAARDLGWHLCAMEQVQQAPAGDVEIAALGDAESEWRCAAQWIVEQLAVNPDGRYAVVIPKLADHHARVTEIFAQALHPDSTRDCGHIEEPLFRVNYAPPLAENPLAQSGLRLLEALQAAPSIDLLRYLLRCPWLLGAETEREARALVEAQLLQLRLDRVPLERFLVSAALRQAAANEGKHLLPLDSPRDWSQVIRLLLDHLPQTLGEQRSPSRWSTYVRGLWNQCLWQGAPSLTSEEYQARHRVLEELAAMRELDAVLPTCDWRTFLLLLRNRFQNVRFQPESLSGSVLVTNLTEVIGLVFDAVWICGMNDDTLPRSVEPDPFIPTALQRQCGIPRSNPEGEAAFASVTIERLLRLAPRCVFSYAQRSGEEELEPSPLLASLHNVKFPDNVDTPPQRSDLPAAMDWEYLEDWQVGPIPEQVRHLRGGSRLLFDQSACPFRAFVQGRLQSESLEWEAPLMSPLDQGSAIHRALELFWQQTESHGALEALSAGQLGVRLEQCVDEALDEFAVAEGDALATAQKLAERERLIELLEEWIELERARAPFCVEQIEHGQEVDLAGVRVRLRTDRVDRMADGSLALIDYKSGAVSPKKWLGERPEEPQLLLYLANEPGEVGALAFASLKAGALGWQVHGKDVSTDFLPTYKESKSNPLPEWDVFRTQAVAVVNELKRQFSEGFAPVDPRDVTTVCSYCAQRPLCRIAELRVDANGEGGDSAGEGDVS